jgi:hypothetical protein
MKVKKKQNPPILLATYCNLSLKIRGILNLKKKKKSGEFGPFFPWKILWMGGNSLL